MSWKAERFAQNSIRQFGMSELSAKRTASSYMAMARNMGLTASVGSDMAITLAGLTGDVASFYNISQEVVDTKLKSIFTGETESLKELGIVMTQTNLQQYALSQGIKTNVSDMNQAELTTLRYNYVLGQLSMAQGDFAKTSGSWANQVRILKEQWGQLLAIIGNGLINVLTPVISVINTVIGKLLTLANVISGVFSRLFGFKSKKTALSTVSSEAVSVSDTIDGVSQSVDGVGKSAKKAAKEIKGALAGFDDLNVLSDSSGSNNDSNSGGTSGGGYAIDPIDWDNAFTEPDTSGVETGIDKVMGYVDKLRSFLNVNKPIIIALISGIMAGFLVFETIKIAPILFSSITGITALFTGWQLSITQTIQCLLGVTGPVIAVVAGVAAVTASLVYLYQTSDSFRGLVKKTVSSVISLLKKLYSGCLKPLFSMLNTLYRQIIRPLISLLANMFVSAVDAVFSILLALLNCVLVPLADFAVDVLAVAIQAVCDIIEGWTPLINNVLLAVRNLWDTALKPFVAFIKDTLCTVFTSSGNVIKGVASLIVSAFASVVNFFLNNCNTDILRAWNSICTVFKNARTSICSLFSNIGSFFSGQWSSIRNAFSNVGSFFSSTFSNGYSGVKNAFSGAISYFSSVVSNIKKPFASISSWFKDTFTKAWTNVKNVFSSGGKIFDGIKNGILSGLKTVVNGLIGGINKVIAKPFNGINSAIKTIRGVNILGIKPFSRLSTISVPSIPKLAYGGVVDKATLGIFGEAGTEAVIPLKNNTQGLDLIAEKIAERLPQKKESGGTYVINLMLPSGEKITSWIIRNIKDYEIRTGKPAFD